MISKILKNETYIGTLIQGKFKKPVRKQKKMVKTDKEDWKIVENHHEAIIDKDIFDTVQNMLNFSIAAQDEEEFLISKLECAECNSGFYRKKAKNYYYYICKSKYRKLGCNLQPIRKDILDELVLLNINDKFKLTYKKLNKNLIDKYVDSIKIYDSNEVEVVYKSDK